MSHVSETLPPDIQCSDSANTAHPGATDDVGHPGDDLSQTTIPLVRETSRRSAPNRCWASLKRADAGDRPALRQVPRPSRVSDSTPITRWSDHPRATPLRP